MTREEAVYQINQLAVLSTDKEIPKITEALDMAIEALQTNLVRCKDCKHYRAEYGSCTAEHWDLSRVTFPHVDQNDYCSYGEKKK